MRENRERARERVWDRESESERVWQWESVRASTCESESKCESERNRVWARVIENMRDREYER